MLPTTFSASAWSVHDRACFSLSVFLPVLTGQNGGRGAQICILLDTCGSYFNKGKAKVLLDVFLIHLQVCEEGAALWLALMDLTRMNEKRSFFGVVDTALCAGQAHPLDRGGLYAK